MTYEQLKKDPNYITHHTAYHQGYVSRKIDPDTIQGTPYKGRFGEGYIVDLPNFNSTWYLLRVYFIKKGVN